MNETITSIKEVITSLMENFEKVSQGNKAAAARARKNTLELEKLGKEFRKKSIEELK